MYFKSDRTNNIVEIGKLIVGSTFVDPNNFDDEDVFMVVATKGYDCHVGFDDDESTVAAINLTSGELWSYRKDEEVIPVETEEVKFKVI